MVTETERDQRARGRLRIQDLLAKLNRKLHRPVTPEEVDAAMVSTKESPMSDEAIDRIVQNITGKKAELIDCLRNRLAVATAYIHVLEELAPTDAIFLESRARWEALPLRNVGALDHDD
ncbi:hypothetical protein LCGC14_1064080 [marine sediment metagenome]|uniref:Uncharacterized protein n=1 Tax=marine sediment metagenome TaxID=412755 RepID=A0A0F9MK39_9ZZZZ